MERVRWQPPRGPDSGPGPLRFVVLALAVTLAGLGGYAGFVIFPRLDLPWTAGAGLLLLAAAAGVASFFSPCSFPLLLTLLARETRGRSRRRAGALLGFALTFSAGAATFLLGLGGMLAAGGGALARSITFTSPAGVVLRVAVGAGLVLLGLIQTGLLSLSFHSVGLLRPLTAVHVGLRRRHPLAGSAAFGFGYLLAGFG